MLLKRLQAFIKIDPDRPQPDDVRMTRTQVHAALALLRKVLPDLASVEVSGNPEKPLMVQVVRFSDGEEISQPRPVLDMGKLIEMDRVETADLEADGGPKYGPANTSGLGTEEHQEVDRPVRKSAGPPNPVTQARNARKRMTKAARIELKERIAAREAAYRNGRNSSG